ncbi:unnamed protein product, partial [Vitis vinifera]
MTTPTSLFTQSPMGCQKVKLPPEIFYIFSCYLLSTAWSRLGTAWLGCYRMFRRSRLLAWSQMLYGTSVDSLRTALSCQRLCCEPAVPPPFLFLVPFHFYGKRVTSLYKVYSRLEEPLQEFPPLRIKDIPAINTCELEAFYQLVAAMVNESKASSGIIWNSFEDLEQSALATIHQDFHIPIFPIGPFHKYSPTSTTLSIQDHSSIAWLDTQAPNSVVYVSFGSIAGLDETDFIEMAWGLANSKQPFLWVVRPGFIRGSEWLEPLPSGFLETIVPMICLPCFSDQKVNARYVSQVWRVGVQLENGLKRGEIEGAIRRLMVEKSGQEIRDRCISLKEKANLCLKQGGSSYQALEDLISYISSFFFHLHAPEKGRLLIFPDHGFMVSLRTLLSLLNINCVAPFRDCLSQLLSNPSEEPIACLITDAVWHFTQAVANSLKLPRMVLRTSSVSSFLAVAAMPYLQKSGYLPIKVINHSLIEVHVGRRRIIRIIGCMFPW